MRALVVGESGFIGSVVSRRLFQNGIEPIGFDLIHNDSSDHEWSSVHGNILDKGTLERTLYDCSVDAIIHLVGLPVVDQCQHDPALSFALNVQSVQNTLEAMRVADVARIVFASSATIYGDHDHEAKKESDLPHPTTVYGWHKHIAEEAIKSYSETYGIKSVVLRLFNVYGGDPNHGKEVVSIFINRARKQEPLTVRGPQKFRDFVHVEDVADAFVKALQRTNDGNVTVNIGTGTRTTLKQLATMIQSLFPHSEITVEAAADDGTGLWANVSVAEERLGFAPRKPSVGILAHVQIYADQVGISP